MVPFLEGQLNHDHNLIMDCRIKTNTQINTTCSKYASKREENWITKLVYPKDKQPQTTPGAPKYTKQPQTTPNGYLKVPPTFIDLTQENAVKSSENIGGNQIVVRI